MKFTTILLSVAVLSGSGCGSTAPGRQLAEDVSSSTAAYEKQVTGKIAVENKFYSEQLRILREHMTGEINFEKFATLSDADKQKLIEQTLLYGRVRLGADRQASLAAARVLDGNASPTTEMIELVDKGVSDDLQYTRDLRARQLALRIDRISGLAKLDFAKDDLATVRRKLASIAADPSATDALNAWLNFGQTLRAELNKVKK